MRKFFIFCMLFLAALALAELSVAPEGHADSIILKNGQTIYGKASREGDKVVIGFGKRGTLAIASSTVAKIIENDLDEFEMAEKDIRPVTASATRTVTVKLKEDRSSSGTGSYVGRLVASADERMLVLEVADGVRLKIPRENIESISETAEDESLPEPAVESGDAEQPIRTTHLVTLENGRQLRGNVVSGDEGPVTLTIGEVGVVQIPRREVVSIEAVEGVYEITPDVVETEPDPDEPPPEPDEAPLEEIKRRVKEEILRDLLGEFVEEKVEETLEEGVGDMSFRGIIEGLSPETILDAQYHVRELGRQRTQNRVRAERHLKNLGLAALPYLDAATSHPFDLTRRAAQRIVREVGDIRGAPYAIEALDDPDFFVRKLAGEALDTLLGAGIAYDPSGAPGRWREAQETYRRLWKEIRRRYLERVVAEEVIAG